MTHLPPLNGLRAFDAAGRGLTFQAAAEELGVTQGAVAQQVRALEKHLGKPLFVRHSKGLEFTVSGRSYHAQIQSAFAQIRQATDSLERDSDKVLVSVTPTFAAKWLIPNLPDFALQHPEIDLQILATEKVSSFYADGIDLAVRQGVPPFGASLKAHLLFPQEIALVASPRFLRSTPAPVSPTALARMTKIHDSHDMWPRVMAHLSIQDESGRGLRLSQTGLAIDAALAGQGVALASRFLVAKDIDAGHLVQVRPETLLVGADFYLLTRRDQAKNQSLQAIVKWMQRLAQF